MILFKKIGEFNARNNKVISERLNQVSVIKQVVEGKLKQIEAAESLGITDRQVPRLWSNLCSRET